MPRLECQNKPDFPCKFALNDVQFYQHDGTRTPVPVLTSGHRHRAVAERLIRRNLADLICQSKLQSELMGYLDDMQTNFYKNKICIVTGAASGIGQAVAELLVKSGAKVISVDKNEELLFEQRDYVTEVKVCNVVDPKQIREVVAYTVNKYGKIDYIFNNAGIVIVGEERDTTLEDWNEVLNTNLNGVINGISAVYPFMVKQGFGHIVNTSSLAGILPVTIENSYVASKYAVVGLSHSLRMEGKKLGVKVSVVCPGGVNTPIMLSSKIVGSKAKQPIEFLQAMPWFPKLIAPEKAANIILKGVAKNQATILTDIFSRLGWYCYRIFPNLWLWLYEAYTMKKFREMRIKNEF